MAKPLFDAEEFARKVRMRLADRNIGMREAAKEIGISLATVSRISRGYAPDVENYLRIERWMGRPPRTNKRGDGE